MAKKKFVGVDLHTNNFMVCYYLKDKSEAYLSFPMNEWGLKYFIATLSKNDEISVESVANVGFFYKKVRRYVKKITIVATGHFAVISKSARKTDWNDAKALAIFLSKDVLSFLKGRPMKYLLHQLSDLAQRRAIHVREEAQLWDILARDLKRAAKELDEAKKESKPTRPKVEPPAEPLPPETRLFVRIKDAQKMMGMGHTALYGEINAGRLPIRKSGRKTLIAVADIHAWFAALPQPR